MGLRNLHRMITSLVVLQGGADLKFFDERRMMSSEGEAPSKVNIDDLKALGNDMEWTARKRGLTKAEDLSRRLGRKGKSIGDGSPRRFGKFDMPSRDEKAS